MSHAEFPSLTVINHPIIQVRLTVLRDNSTDTPSFRKALHDVALLAAYQITSDLELNEVKVETPLVTTSGAELARPLVLVPILPPPPPDDDDDPLPSRLLRVQTLNTWVPGDCIEDSADHRELGVLVTGVVRPPEDSKPRRSIRRSLGRLLGNT